MHHSSLKGTPTCWVVAVSLVVASLGAAPAARAEEPAGGEQAVESVERPDPGLWVGEEYRYGRKGVFERTLLDIVAVPAAAARWNDRDWAVFGGVVGSSALLILPMEPSPDVRIERWIQEDLDPWFPDIWGTEFQVALWGSLGVTTLGTWGYALLFDRPEIAQGMSLMAEAVGVSQVYHLTIKFLTGRQGPRRAGGLGLFKGPAGAVEFFPEGTPSGHFATLYAVFGSIQAYWQIPLGWDIFGHGLLGTLAATHVINHRHFLSEIILGSAIGYSVSHWVVRNRSTRFRYDRDGEPVRISLLPAPGGFALSVRF